MADQFWTAPQRDPMRKYRFLMVIPSLPQGGMWYIKKVKKPKANLSETPHSYLNHTFKYPGRVTWDDCEVTLVDPTEPGTGQNLAAILQASGYVVPKTYNTVTTISKHRAIEMLGGRVEILQIDDHLDEAGDIVPFGDNASIVEQWVLQNPWVKDVDWGEADYESDDLSEVVVTFAYDWAQLTKKARGTFFENVGNVLPVNSDIFKPV